jgi:hypothetical protein|tara:strand:- start:578 stop:784 length:207 start_codon:yes stop_codon:yes gene_type:complete
MEIQLISGQYHIIESGISLFDSSNRVSSEHMLAWMVSGEDAVVDCVFGCDENGNKIDPTSLPLKYNVE